MNAFVSGDAALVDVVQMQGQQQVHLDRFRDALLTDVACATQRHAGPTAAEIETCFRHLADRTAGRTRTGRYLSRGE